MDSRNNDPCENTYGFVPRKGVNEYRIGIDYMPRPDIKLIRQFFFESSFNLTSDLSNKWESYRIFSAPVHFKLESADRFEFNIAPAGEQIPGYAGHLALKGTCLLYIIITDITDRWSYQSNQLILKLTYAFWL